MFLAAFDREIIEMNCVSNAVEVPHIASSFIYECCSSARKVGRSLIDLSNPIIIDCKIVCGRSIVVIRV